MTDPKIIELIEAAREVIQEAQPGMLRTRSGAFNHRFDAARERLRRALVKVDEGGDSPDISSE